MTSKPVTSKRLLSAPAAPAVKTPCHIHPSAIVADKAQITGAHAVEIGENAVIHPYAKIRAEGGKVVIGNNSMVYERAVVGVAEGGEQDVVIGEGVNIDTGAVIEAKNIGDGSTIEVNAIIGKGTVLGRYCKVASLERVEAGEELEDFMVVYSDGQRRIDKTMKDHPDIREAKRVGQEKSIELMRKMLPNAAAKWM
ncbi:hypothetical protein LTR36_002448 [Oleoguttula mirabilis]|uniref:Dynactin subunit 6 n=1 Tax=Oleoguttula mirabilis TaxID=1507867 RepID=A0AAV9JK87_9PEZI|nr:hypothetical protein LTR36_002448 [Oleoguttula mirabilis]